MRRLSGVPFKARNTSRNGQSPQKKGGREERDLQVYDGPGKITFNKECGE